VSGENEGVGLKQGVMPLNRFEADEKGKQSDPYSEKAISGDVALKKFKSFAGCKRGPGCFSAGSR